MTSTPSAPCPATNSSASIARRFAHLEALRANPPAWDLQRELCAGDVAYWLENWGWTYDPREPDAAIPFDPFPVQRAFLTWLAEREKKREDGLVEKSRDMGVTWLCVAYAVHGWLYRPGYAVGFGSRKLDLVDRKGDPDCIFEKARFLLSQLPVELLPRGFVLGQHDAYCRLVNPANGATITGEGGDGIGRGGRKSVYFVDEAAFLERPQLVDRSLAATTDVRIDVSTPNGPGNAFAARRFGGKVSVFTLHYRDDPRKTAEWVAKKKASTDPVTWAQEYEIDYTASIEDIAIPAAWVRAAVNLPLPPSGPVVAGFDVMELGRDRNVFTPRRGPVVLPPSDWGPMNTTESSWKMVEEARKAGAVCVAYDAPGVGAGVRGTLDTAQSLPFQPVAVNPGESPSGAYWPDGLTSAERFVNRRAELWWLARARFEKAYEHATQGTPHPPEEMISIPDHPQLIAELSQPLVERRETGKIQIEPKPKMRLRGVKSPNFADSLILSFAADGLAWTPAAPDAKASLVARMPAGVGYQPPQNDPYTPFGDDDL